MIASVTEMLVNIVLFPVKLTIKIGKGFMNAFKGVGKDFNKTFGKKDK